MQKICINYVSWMVHMLAIAAYQYVLLQPAEFRVRVDRFEIRKGVVVALGHQVRAQLLVPVIVKVN